MAAPTPYDFVIVGGGFYGCCLALYLRSLSESVLVIEEQDALLTRASRVNQARVHTGFHYPRSFVTALRSRQLSARFAADFSEAVVDDFRMLYAIARRRSKVSTGRFQAMFRDMGAQFEPADDSDAALFDPQLIEGVFNCAEFAFDWTVLQARLQDRLRQAGVTVLHGETAIRAVMEPDLARVECASGKTFAGRALFNVTYAGLNRLPFASGFEPLPIKHELAEVALVCPPRELEGRGVTVMDGPFFSMMPYPAQGLYSFTHVRYTPHMSWRDAAGSPGAYAVADSLPRLSRWRHMMMDARRYLPCAAGVSYADSLFDVKTVLTHNERDDGRPILLHRHHAGPDFYSVMGGKIDNIYDLFDALPGMNPAFAGADDRYLLAPC
ncbi:MAG: FAD-dependent oxidoreductase [Novosphingobium sp.]